MTISGRSETFSKGRLDNADVKFTNTRLEMIESKRNPGTENPFLVTDFVDIDGTEYSNQRFIILGGNGRNTRLAVIDGKLVCVDSDGEEIEGGALSDRCSAAKLLDSLEDLGFSKKKLDVVFDQPEVLDDQWVHVEQKPTGRKDEQTGNEYTELIVTALLDEDELAGGKKKAGAAKTSSKGVAASTKGKSSKSSASKAVKEEEDDDEAENAEEDEESEASDEDETADEESTDETEEEADEEEGGEDEEDSIVGEARDLTLKVLSNLPGTVKNFNPKKNGGGATVREVYTASFAAYKGKNKGPVTSVIRDPEFHTANAEAGLYRFDEEIGILYPKKAGK